MAYTPSLIPTQRNSAVAQLYEDAVQKEGAVISSNGALINFVSHWLRL